MQDEDEKVIPQPAEEEPKPSETPEPNVEEPAGTPPAAPEEPAPSEPEEPETPEPSKKEEAEEEPETPPSRRENKRIQQILDKYKQDEERQRPATPQSERQTIGEGDYTTEELNQIVETERQSGYQAGLQMANAIQFSTRLEIDAPKVAQKYEILNQDSDSFDPGVAAFINEAFLRTVGYNPNTGTVQNPNIRYEEYVDATMELADSVASARVADDTQANARAASRTGVRPAGVAKKAYQGDDPSKMTNEQLEAAIATTLGLK